MQFPLPEYVFVIDTEQYAGNFERSLCAYVTGCVGECTVGEEDAVRFRLEFPDDNPFEDLVQDVPDESGCRRPATVWATPGWFNNGMGGEFRDGDDLGAQQHYEASCIEEAKREHYADPAHNAEHRIEFEKMAQQPFTRYPAYRSVAICLSDKPSDELVAIMKKRAAAFCSDQGIPLVGYRLIRVTLTEQEVDISKS